MAMGVGGDGFAQGGGIGALKGGDGDLEPREELGRAVVAQVGGEPFAGGVVIDGVQELAEALGTGMGVFEDAVDGSTLEAGGGLQSQHGGFGVVVEVIDELDREVAHDADG